MSSSSQSTRTGVAYGLAAYLFWGFVPIYFKSVSHVPPLEVLAHRIIWSCALLTLILLLNHRWAAVRQALAHRSTRLGLLASTILVAINWFVFIWAVDHNQIVQASLGYFINPLVNVLLGFVFLRERLRSAQKLSVFLATCGVIYLGVSYGHPPWIALTLAFSFGFYGLIRKIIRADALVGLTVETLWLLPLALGYLLYLNGRASLNFGHQGLCTNLLLVLSGAVTALPLWWFAEAARRLRYATVGFLQYSAPTLQFLLAVVVYGEPFTRTHLISFSCIWTALAIYSWDSWRAGRPQSAAGG